MKRTHAFRSDFPPDLNDAELDALRHLSWQIDCPRMILKSRSPNKPETYYGSGIIAQSDRGQLNFKLFATRERNTEKWVFASPYEAGEILPDKAYFDLKATDFNGREWKSDRFIPSFSRSASGKAVVSGEIYDLFATGDFPPRAGFSGCSLSFWVFDAIKIPFNERTSIRKSVARGRQKFRSGTLNAWKFRCLNTDFLIVQESNDLLTIRAYSTKYRFPKYFENRIIEALELVLGRPIQWLVMKKRIERSLEIVVRSKRSISSKGRFQAPLPNTLIENPKTGKLTSIYHRNLVELYLKHTLGHDVKRHPLWGKRNAIYEASSASFIDAEALTLTVVIESLLTSEFPNLGHLSNIDVRWVRKASDYFEAWNGKEEIKNRIRGLISTLNQPRALDIMRELERLGAITDGQYRAWQKLRNPSAHSYQSSNIPTRELIDLLEENRVLFYHLIFFAIGYKGPYVDYTTPDWPLKRYPDRTPWI